MKEELKQAIEENLNKHRHETILNFEGYKKRVNWILQDPNLLRHADPEIMRQAGWVREESLKEIKHHILSLVDYDNKGHLCCNATEWSLSELHRLINELLPQPPKQ